jgi:predicted phage terminase large subunit-like protein
VAGSAAVVPSIHIPDEMLHAAQWEIFRDRSRFRVVAAGRRFGKALSLDTPLPTPDGWTPMRDIQPGDTVYDMDGQRCTVTFKSEVQYGDRRLTLSGGVQLDCSLDHQWVTTTKLDRTLQVRTTREIEATLDDQHLIPASPLSPPRRVTGVDTTVLQPMQCIQVDSPTATYLAGEAYTVTHNTHMGCLECILVAAAGGTSWWVAPAYPLTNPGWRLMMFLAAQFPGTTMNKVERRVEFPGGGWLQVRSAHNEGSLRGEGLDFVVIDEAAYMPQERWTQELRPALADKRGRALFISSPAGTENWFYRLWATEREGWRSWQMPSSSNPLMTEAEIADLAADLNPWEYEQEIEAKFVDHVIGGLFQPQHLSNMYTLHESVDGAGGSAHYYNLAQQRLIPTATTTRLAAADLAYSEKQMADFTVFGIADVPAERDVILMRYLHRERLEFAKQVDMLERQYNAWNPQQFGVEKAASQGLPTIQTLRKRGVPVIDLPARGDKVARASTLLSYAQANNLWLPADGHWIEEFTRELLSFPVGSFDDQVDTAAYLAMMANKDVGAGNTKVTNRVAQTRI